MLFPSPCTVYRQPHLETEELQRYPDHEKRKSERLFEVLRESCANKAPAVGYLENQDGHGRDDLPETTDRQTETQSKETCWGLYRKRAGSHLKDVDLGKERPDKPIPPLQTHPFWGEGGSGRQIGMEEGFEVWRWWTFFS